MLTGNDKVIRGGEGACSLHSHEVAEGVWLKFSAELFQRESTWMPAKNSGCSLHSVPPPLHTAGGLLEAPGPPHHSGLLGACAVE